MMKRVSQDYVIVILTILLITFGVAMLGSASSNLSHLQRGDSLYYLKHQLLYGLSLGILGFILCSHIYYKRYEKYAVLGIIIGIILLILTFTPLAFETKGAARWLHLGPITFQPSEPLKLFFILYLAAWLAGSRHRARNATSGFIAFLAMVGIVIALLLKQPATSTAMLLAAVALIMYFISGSRLMHIAIIVSLIAGTLALVIYFSPYRLARIQAFLNPEQNTQTTGYQANQAKIAIGSGKLWGVGYGQSTTKINSLPEPLADSIFAVISEELGFLGSLTLIGLFLTLVMRILFIARHTRDQFGQLLLIGFGSLIALQSFINIAAISGIIPLTGMPLPFISYGGTALAVLLTMMGITNNISQYS